MGGVCTKATEQLCREVNNGKSCGFGCACMACTTVTRCDCSCFYLEVGGLIIFTLSAWIVLLAYRERRKWLLTWSAIYAISSAALTLVTHAKGPDSHEWYGCSVPLSLWALFLFITTLSYYTSDYMHQGQLESERGEKYVYDPKVNLRQHGKLAPYALVRSH